MAGPGTLIPRALSLMQGGFVRDVSLLTLGTVFAQVLAVAVMPLATRLYDPQDFSVLAVYIAVLGIVGVVACARYDIAIPLPETEREAMAVTVAALGCATALTLVLSLAVAFASPQIATLLRQPALQPYMWMLPVGVGAAAFYSALQYWASRHRRFGLITQTRISRAVSGAGVQVGVGLVHASPFGLLLGHLIYSGAGVLGLAGSLWRNDRAALRQVTVADVRTAMGEYRRFPLYSVPESLLNVSASQLPIIVIAGAVAGPEAGFLMLAMRVMGLPMALIGASVAQVYLAEAPRRLREGRLDAFTRDTMFGLLKTGGPVLILMGVAAPFLFPFVFGQEWQRAGALLAWMTPWFVLQFMTSPVSMLLHVVGRQRLAMALQGFGLLTRLGAVIVALRYFEAWTPEIYAVSGAVFYAAYLGVVYLVSRKSAS